jgi:hypothetical protein
VSDSTESGSVVGDSPSLLLLRKDLSLVSRIIKLLWGVLATSYRSVESLSYTVAGDVKEVVLLSTCLGWGTVCVVRGWLVSSDNSGKTCEGTAANEVGFKDLSKFSGEIYEDLRSCSNSAVRHFIDIRSEWASLPR